MAHLAGAGPSGVARSQARDSMAKSAPGPTGEKLPPPIRHQNRNRTPAQSVTIFRAPGAFGSSARL
jgi:hypothetical protein